MPSLEDFRAFLEDTYQQRNHLGRISSVEYVALDKVFADAYERNPADAGLAAGALMVELAAARPAEPLRPFSVWNETALHLAELDASSHEDAARRYREQFKITGFARLRTSDGEVFFDLREGALHQVHYTR